MNRTSCTERRFPEAIAVFAITLCLTIGVASVAAADQGVIITGVQADDIEFTNTADAGFTIQDYCNQANIIDNEIGRALMAVDLAITESGWAVPLSTIESMPDMPSRWDIATDAANARTAICNNEQQESRVETFTITYSSCRMDMTTPSYAMVISIPDGTDTAVMLAADHATREVAHFEMTAWVEESNQYTGAGWSDQMALTPTGQSTEIFGFDTEHYTFTLESGLGETEMGELGQNDIEAGQINNEQRLGNLVKVTSTGNTWIAPDAPGIDIVKTFYERLTSRFRPDAGAHSFMSGMINSMVGILEKGIPIVMQQKNTSSMMGREMGGGESESHVVNIRLWDLPPDWCGAPPTPPDGYTVSNLNEAMSDMQMPSSAEMATAMQDYEAAMAGMTDEERQMLEQMGMGDLMQQAMSGGANPAAAQQAPAATAAGGAASRGGSAIPPSSDLTTGDLTESVQLHLQALGYNVGDINGEVSLSTQIAISTFQAEKGLEVTGEVTPQLLGLLSAEVDSRR